MKAIKLISLALLLLPFVPASAKRTKQQKTHEYVDLGLSVNWATCNVGADKPEEDGTYFAWGETETKTSDYLFDDYKWYASDRSGEDKENHTYVFSFNKYNHEDGKTNLDPEDDVAKVKWGGNWRMPTKEECQELIDSCTCTWETVNGVNGIRLTSKKKGYEDRSLFLPATGYHNMYSTEINHMTHNGNVVQLYSSTKDSNHDDYAFVMHCARWSEYQKNVVPEVSFVSRCSAQFVRPVSPKKPKAGDKISGIVTDSVSPLMAVYITELDSADRTVAYAYTDLKGEFSFRLVNPKDRIQFSFYRKERIVLPIEKTFYEIRMKDDKNLPPTSWEDFKPLE